MSTIYINTAEHNTENTSRDKIIEILFILYSRRLKYLLGCEDDNFIKELLQLMFHRFDEISKLQGFVSYSNNMNKLFNDVLNFTSNMPVGQNSVTELINRLEEYIKQNIAVFWPNENFDYKKEDNIKKDYRAFVNDKFKQLISEGKLPFKGFCTDRKIYTQLYDVVKVRNKNTHISSSGVSVYFKRYHFLETSEIILGYILHTFYYKSFLTYYKRR